MKKNSRRKTPPPIRIIDYTGAGPSPLRGKFVQMTHGGDAEYIIFSPKELSAYHADIVERFCGERGIAGKYDRDKKKFLILDPGWSVSGGGKFEIDRPGRRIHLYDNSMAYGRFVAEGLREKIETAEGFKNFDVTIE